LTPYSVVLRKCDNGKSIILNIIFYHIKNGCKMSNNIYPNSIKKQIVREKNCN